MNHWVYLNLLYQRMSENLLPRNMYNEYDVTDSRSTQKNCVQPSEPLTYMHPYIFRVKQWTMSIVYPRYQEDDIQWRCSEPVTLLLHSTRVLLVVSA